MGVYYCTCCDTLHDGDYIPCAEHPNGSTDLICEEAAQEMAEQKHQGEFNKSQLAFIAKMEDEDDENL